ncbi:MAG: hypothetical protein ACWGIK_01100 [Achromobacter pulmonis]|jgi:hypothetical protein|uniref:Uncharacterized protein n=1 Tax=Achromobacter pulmonis TaxID=1389932 RepID=A0A6S7E199_9BURK|nr:hypothetical protein [Achromobacter pulmonis]MCF7769192.1 hypothetical protein [Achromobacter pulmonis]CAB3646719.1 hypothetical protein LMG26696_02536 [Achromobacter pulmonis]CAB3891828.1 hypothetical protein LMG26788_03817 [Achromobacter pulmonis]
MSSTIRQSASSNSPTQPGQGDPAQKQAEQQTQQQKEDAARKAAPADQSGKKAPPAGQH